MHHLKKKKKLSFNFKNFAQITDDGTKGWQGRPWPPHIYIFFLYTPMVF